MKVSEATRKAMQRYPHLREYLDMGVINQRAMARQILGEVKKELGGEVNLQSVVTAVRRFSVSKKRSKRSPILDVLAKSDVNLKYDICIATLPLKSGIQKNVVELQKRMSGKEALQMIQGPETLTLVFETDYLEEVHKLFGKGIIELRERLASLVVMSSKEIAETAGVIAHLATSLSIEGINVVEMMSSYTETLFIIEEENALKAVGVVREEIKRARL